ncbi:predicted protein [Coccidioides posadasii str. Silveira]|uniref:Predicted protein n=1 Tax=Coccidioides posadasii (strain RMSCC 757 / Silveira) TaxID=443226 RepID=E9DK18_COCPS|nr:predicted protein [Coccidioides posadasii str. Silveira]
MEQSGYDTSNLAKTAWEGGQRYGASNGVSQQERYLPPAVAPAETAFLRSKLRLNGGGDQAMRLFLFPSTVHDDNSNTKPPTMKPSPRLTNLPPATNLFSAHNPAHHHHLLLHHHHHHHHHPPSSMPIVLPAPTARLCRSPVRSELIP